MISSRKDSSSGSDSHVRYRTYRQVNHQLFALIKMPADSSYFMGNLDWIKLYRAVLKESDTQKRLAQIEEAERVMKQALRSAVEEGDSDQLEGNKGSFIGYRSPISHPSAKGGN